MKYNIVIVDDDPNLLSGLKRSMHGMEEKWNIFYTQSPDEVIAVCAKETIDIVITDYKMPSMDGLTLLAAIKSQFPKIKRVILTGQSEEEIFEKSKDVADKYLSKPCAALEIIETIKKLLN